MTIRCTCPCYICLDEPPVTNEKRDQYRERAAHVIRELVQMWGIHPFDINNGDCEEFALQLIDCLQDGADEFDCEDVAHMCVLYRGRYYDAEEPYGVQHWTQLPLVLRNRRDD